MRYVKDNANNTAYLYLSTETVVSSKEFIADNVIVDLDLHGKPVGIELLNLHITIPFEEMFETYDFTGHSTEEIKDMICFHNR